jgi:transposase-like protein
LDQNIDFNGTLYIDGYWVKAGWRKFIEAQLGRKLNNREWKKLRYQVIYVVATEEKVVLDFQITNIMPSYLELVPLMNRIKNRIPEDQLLKIVSDEDNAIIDAVKRIFPNVVHSFCVFHQLKNVSLKYLDEFGSIENIPVDEVELYEATTDLILADNAIESTICYQRILELASSMKLSKASKKVIAYMKEIYVKNIKNLEKGFTPETNNVMEQLFSLINDFMNQARSFKINEGLSNFCYNLFTSLNNKIFNTGLWKGFSPVQRAKIKYG